MAKSAASEPLETEMASTPLRDTYFSRFCVPFATTTTANPAARAIEIASRVTGQASASMNSVLISSSQVSASELAQRRLWAQRDRVT